MIYYKGFKCWYLGLGRWRIWYGGPEDPGFMWTGWKGHTEDLLILLESLLNKEVIKWT